MRRQRQKNNRSRPAEALRVRLCARCVLGHFIGRQQKAPFGCDLVDMLVNLGRYCCFSVALWAPHADRLTHVHADL